MMLTVHMNYASLKSMYIIIAAKILKNSPNKLAQLLHFHICSGCHGDGPTILCVHQW